MGAMDLGARPDAAAGRMAPGMGVGRFLTGECGNMTGAPSGLCRGPAFRDRERAAKTGRESGLKGGAAYRVRFGKTEPRRQTGDEPL